MLKTIKQVDDITWARFKSLAAKKETPMGNLLKLMVDGYEQRSKDFWEGIINGGKILSDGESLEMKKTIENVRKEHGFRS